MIEGKPPGPNKELNDLENKFADRRKVWENTQKFDIQYNEWLNKNFKELDVEQIEKDMKAYENDCIQLRIKFQSISKGGKDSVLESLTAKVGFISELRPIISSLGNKDLRERHMDKIFGLIGQVTKKVFTLKELIADGIKEFKDQIAEISGTASGEAQIEEQLNGIRSKWAELSFVVNKYRDANDKFIVAQVDEVIQALDDNQLTIQTLLGTRFVAGIRSQVEEWQNKLALIADVIDEWLTCQRQWMYLENIFGAEDIQKQLPEEAAKFSQVDKFWRDLMMKAFKKPLVHDLCANEEVLKKLQHNNKVLDSIQKSLESYLEKKRAAFPRFYFLSNDELIEILSQTRNPHAVQPHLRKCFDNINRVAFSDVEESREIIAMISAEPETEPERVPFSKSVMAEGAVEFWLFNIQEMMIQTLYDITKKAHQEYPANGLERNDWLFQFPAQSILVVDLIMWTANCASAISEMKQNSNAVKEFLEFSKKQITGTVSLVMNELTTAQRTLLGALIVLDVHARDVVQQLIENKIETLEAFDWTKQLRYYWETDVDNCVVRQTNTKFIYGYEYLGNGPRLVITPLTDKCYITLTSAHHLNYGGAPQGPAGTGKTETTKDLAKALAIQCIVFNCSDTLEYRTMGRFFSGLAQGGAWACFDEFNRIDIEVLSVIAQQIMTIQNAIRAKVDEFFFETSIIPLNPRFGVYITMNPGYAGRTELPDNLKALFRPVSMMIPDYGLIAEIILFSEGFTKAHSLARKMVQLYKLSSEQLSKQDHYDFGMRAVKSVLVMAGSLRRQNPDLSETVVLIRAMRDSNVPKFLADDLPLFTGIIEDLFPNEEVPFVDYGNLKMAIEHQLEQRKYQKPDMYVKKIIQLMETIMVRHGVMLVGVTGTGKTTCYEILAKAMGQLHDEGSKNFYHKKVDQYVLNPKAVTMNELFGFVNVLTNEWTDGIVADIVRRAVQDESDNKKWIVFDGPVDAGWIENMNTVLDDNKMLCLPNGQRIKLPSTFTMMFEVQDLAVASPATVSRCGMVYLETVHLGWQPLLDTWAASLAVRETTTTKDGEVVPQPWIKTVVEKLRGYLKDGLSYIKDYGKEKVPAVHSNLVQSCLSLFDTMLGLYKASWPPHVTPPEKEYSDSVTLIMIFSLIWSLGANLDDQTRVAFGHFLKMKLMSTFTNFPFGELYDFYVDFGSKSFKHWNEQVPEFQFDPKVPYFNILVPTSDTVKYKFLVKNLCSNGRNVLITGETGVGKSVIVQDFLKGLDEKKYVSASINFSAQTSSLNVLDIFHSKLEKKNKSLLGAPAGKKMIMFIDDINMPQLDRYGAQPPVELLRQSIDQGGFYDLKKLNFKRVQDCQYIAACAPPGGGRNAVSPRLFRHFNMMWLPTLSQASMELIFTSILKGFLAGSDVNGLDKWANEIVKSSVKIYQNITQFLLPTPTKSHYTFNLRDLSKVIQGILQVDYEHIPNKEILVELWIHEVSRVFYDRLAEEKDRDWFFTQIEDQLRDNLDSGDLKRDDFRHTLFGDYANNERQYKKVTDNFAELAAKFDDYLTLYNAKNTKSMNLVFFKDALDHLSRIIRVLRQQRGNALLIGVGGSGRQSLTRLAASIRNYDVFQIEITKNYKDVQFKDDLKKLLKIAGAQNQPVVFLFSDTQIVKESFLEDINNLLNTGEVPNLWAPEDMEGIISDVRPLAKEAGKIDARDVIYQHFVQLVRENLHIVLTFSPVGDKLRNRCRQFPSVINCCTLDWFDRWPEEALHSVAEREYRKEGEKLGIMKFKDQLATLSVEIHSTVTEFSGKFYSELRRRTYTTPTSYLELLRLYQSMLSKQLSILPLKIRKYTVGIETLNETNAVVAELQKKIIEFQPILDQAAKENTALMAELEVKTAEASEQELKCKQEADEIQIVADEVNELKESCQKELDEALPALEKAKKAVKNINSAQISEMKGFSKPPALVQIAMSAVCLLIYKNKKKENWDDAKKLLSQMDFLDQLTEFQGDTLPEWVLERLRSEYLARPDFNEKSMMSVSQAATALVIWAQAIDKFAKVKKIVGPKEKKLAEAEKKLNEVTTELKKKQAALQEVRDKVAALQENLINSQKKAQSYANQQETAKKQLVRAEKLVAGLGSESERWKVTVKLLEDDSSNVAGNIIVAAAVISYLGPFTSEYRSQMTDIWVKRAKELKIPISDNFNLERILVEPIQLREWQTLGLPADQLSTVNGIMIFNCRRWPLIIDPQGQANRWVRNLYKDTKLQVIKLSEPNYPRTLENAVRFGQPVLLENVEETLDPTLEPVLLKQVFTRGMQQLLKMGDQEVPYNPEFKFFVTTKMPNPHYLPEICIKVTIINFTVTLAGLEDQLLAEVVKVERPELEEKRGELIVQVLIV